MDDLGKALSDISSIRQQMARATEFRGYGPATLATTAMFALLAAGLQQRWIPDPAHQHLAYLALWIATAIVSAGLIGIQMYRRTQRIHSGLADEMILTAVAQFLPAAGAGALMAVVIAFYAPGVLWMLPGLWQVAFSLGVFSSCRFLPRSMIAAGIWYLFTGLYCLSLNGDRAFTPWAMGIPYAVGQLLVAAVLLIHRKEAEDAN